MTKKTDNDFTPEDVDLSKGVMINGEQTTVVDAIDHVAQLYIQRSKLDDPRDVTSIEHEITEYKGALAQVPATYNDLEDAVSYLIASYSKMLYRNSVADKSRMEVLTRALEANRVLSKNVLASMHDQLDAINDEENKGDM